MGNIFANAAAITNANAGAPATPGGRIPWVDYAKGLSIIMVLTLHVSLGVQKAMGDCTWFAHFVEWARPFRIPAFFLLSGLFLARRVNWPWREFLDRRVVHFAWFYVLWLTISFIFKGAAFANQYGVDGTLKLYALSFIDPFGTLWFIYLLAVFAVAVKLLKDVPAWIVWPAAALLEALPIHTGWMLPDEFAARFVYFYTGYLAAPYVFRFAEGLTRLSLPVLFTTLLLWALAEAALVFANVPGLAPLQLVKLPGISLALGLIGSLAVVAAGVFAWRLSARIAVLDWLRLIGTRTLSIYVSFFLFMATARILLVKMAPGLGPDIISLLVLAAAVVGPLLLHALVRGTPLSWLYERPAWFTILPRNALAKRQTARHAAE